jgi:glycosyltransferase involved in cell wall biosynthesis
MPSLRSAAVIPVRGHESLLRGCLADLDKQSQPLDEIIVVDDSPDGSLEAPQGVEVRRSGGRGPYFARNLGWQSTTADVIFFLDARSRPRRGLVATLLRLFDDPGVALAGSEVNVLDGGSLGARASHRQQFFRLKNYVEEPFFMEYLPTCNLAVRRADLEHVGGFRSVRSGGDADLCWRVLMTPGRRLEVVEETLMDWVPRDRATDFIEQNYRYGKSHFALRKDWSGQGLDLVQGTPRHRLLKTTIAIGARYAHARVRKQDDEAVEQLVHASGVLFELGYRVAQDQASFKAAGLARWRTRHDQAQGVSTSASRSTPLDPL